VKPSSRWAVRGALVLWLLATVLIGTATTSLHLRPLPTGEARAMAASSQWEVIHVLSSKCPCSRRVSQSLLARGASSEQHEQVVLLDASPAEVNDLKATGFEVTATSAEHLRTGWGVEAAPMLIIHRPDGSLAYQGAYGPTRGTPPRDLEVLARVRAGEILKPWLLLGCAVSRSLQQQSDPLGLKY
jgi:hypothetical protein